MKYIYFIIFIFRQSNTVLQIDQSQCRSSANNIEVSSKLSISSDILANANCGSSSMTFMSRPGQQLNISITDFTFGAHQHNSRSCINYLEIVDPAKENPIPVCAGAYGRTGNIMLSEGHEIQTTFHVQDPKNQRFILSFEGKFCF